MRCVACGSRWRAGKPFDPRALRGYRSAKGLPRGGYTELDLKAINYLRELVELQPETVSKLPVERDRRRVKANQIRRAVKRHSQVAPGSRRGAPGSSKPGKPAKSSKRS